MSPQAQGGLGKGLGALFPHMNPTQPAPESEKEAPVQQKPLIKKPLTKKKVLKKKVVVKNIDKEEKDLPEEKIMIRLQYIDPKSIVTNPHQPRRYFDEVALEELTQSIREHGIMQPLVVTKTENDGFELIAGERRLRAARALKLMVVPVLVRDVNEQEKLELALIENIQRAELSAVEEARAYEAMSDLFSLTQADIATKVGKSRSTVANVMRLLDLEKDMLDALTEGKITRSHARTLLSELNRERRRELFEQMINGDLTVREAESATKRRRRRTVIKDPVTLSMESDLQNLFATKVKIKSNSGKGKIEIHFFNNDELKEILEKIQS